MILSNFRSTHLELEYIFIHVRIYIMAFIDLYTTNFRGISCTECAIFDFTALKVIILWIWRNMVQTKWSWYTFLYRFYMFSKCLVKQIMPYTFFYILKILKCNGSTDQWFVIMRIGPFSLRENNPHAPRVYVILVSSTRYVLDITLYGYSNSQWRSLHSNREASYGWRWCPCSPERKR